MDVAIGIQIVNADAAGAAMMRIMQRTLTAMSTLREQTASSELTASS